ncbi:MAG TPA: phosphoethanolamine transferase [Oligoflexus sp.]|uniref:phosphoethanolamine transferase n=1 Tax=Oligoflexus sp. TaxID=1971216 RepID=UPI002D2529FD|nr:phosphoethanolamine transferase [Oligoflexus sp.]HYX38498.1 phosphoethanolamine transferase [Oligoflexus sp.]
MDDLYRLDLYGWLILASLCFLQIAMTSIPGKFGSWFGLSVLGLASFCTLCNVLTLGIFKSPVTFIALSTAIQSNTHEVTEFLATYGTQFALSGGIAVSLSVILIGLYVVSQRPRTHQKAAMSLMLSFLCSMPVLYQSRGDLNLFARNVHEHAFVDRLFTSLIRYQGIMEAREKAKVFWSQRRHGKEPLKLDSASHKPKPQLVVVVIGESTSRNHLGIYGYHRPTTPRLESMKDQLLVFRDAISPVASTLPAVFGALCSSQFDYETFECGGPTLLEIAQAAGYKTTWISNQAPTGFGDNFLVELGRTADTAIFVNQDISSAGEADHSSSFDEKVLGPLDKVIQSTLQHGQQSMFFLHLMGTHFVYEKRYPRDQRMFQNTHDLKIPATVKDPHANDMINHYDNAVAYQDRILGEIMGRINTSGKDALLVYFSDHGEEVYDTDNFAGHSEDRVTPSMREIPFIVGYSPSYARHTSELNRIRTYANRPFSTFQLTPSVAGLLGLYSDAFSQQDNVFSEDFQPTRGAMSAERKASRP